MLKFKGVHRFVFAALLMALSYNLASGQTTAFTYQGKLTDAGNPANGNYDLQFKLFDALSSGAQQGATATNPTVAVSAGIFTVTLDFGANVFSGANRWLEIGVRPAGSVNAYTVLAPRQPMTSTPYAIQTLKATSADTLSSACVGCVQDTQINSVAGSKVSGAIPVASVPAGSANYIQNGTALQALSNFNISGDALIGGNVGIGTVAPTNKLTVQTPSNTYGVMHTDGVVSVGSYVGVGSGAFGGWFGTKSNHPLFFYTNGGSAQMTLTPDGAVGIGTSAPNAQLHVSSALDTGIYSQTSSGYGVVGNGRFGVYGNTSSAVSTEAGVYGFSSGSQGTGVIGEANNGANAKGVYAKTTNGYGVYALATGAGGTAIAGGAISPATVAGLFAGNVLVSGSLTKSSGSFKIDHPLDPANKYLYHSFVESPDMMNIYNGVVRLGEFGAVEITLPDWFEALNKDFRYQLTAIGMPGPNLYVAEKVKGNHFKIAGGSPGMEVSWQVTGIRQDAWANEHRIPVEENKSEKESGYYLHPELFGQSEEKSIEWSRDPSAMRKFRDEREQPSLPPVIKKHE